MGGIAACLCMACGGNDSKDYWGDTSGGEDEEPTENPNASKPRYIWIDAAANFPDFANSKENIARDLALAKDAGFTDIVVDVRPTTGDVLFKTNLVDQVKFMYAWIGSNYTKVERTATWDYLQAFVDEARKQGLRIHAAINTFVGGNQIDGGTGLQAQGAGQQAAGTTGDNPWNASANASGNRDTPCRKSQEMEIDEFILTPCPDSRREESQRPDGFSGLLRDTTGTDTGQY